MFFFFSNRLGCIGSILVSLVLSAVLLLALRACNAGERPVTVQAQAAAPR